MPRLNPNRDGILLSCGTAVETMRHMSRSARFCLALAAAMIVPAIAIHSDTPVGRSSPRPAQAAAWTETKWPFPIDQWGAGRAFRCGAADCGVELSLYLRPKIGFCNCTTGVADDAELDRVGDVELIGEKFAPLRQGRPVTVGHMRGRSRLYVVEVQPRRNAIAIAFNDKCDVVVATVVSNRELPPSAEPHAVAFLNGGPVLRWVETTLGL